MSKIACFTGHRPNKLNSYKKEDNKELLKELKRTIIDHIENKEVSTFINGMALGIDMWSAEIVLELKKQYQHIKLICAIPCKRQYAKWNKESYIQWLSIKNKADKVHYVSKEPYTAWCMQKRNEWMVDNSDYVIAVWDGSNGGTGNCIKYARKKHKAITIIDPKHYKQ